MSDAVSQVAVSFKGTPVTVLAPAAARRLFHEDPVEGVSPLFYERRRLTVHERVRCRLVRTPPGELLRSILREESAGGDIAKPVALWLAPEFYLSSQLLAAWLDRLPSLRWVYSQVKGSDHLDLRVFTDRGIMVSHSGNLVSAAVAEMAITCICSHAKRLPVHFALQQRRHWQSVPASDLEGQTVGIIGTGDIGASLSNRCRGLGMKTVGASRNPGRFEGAQGPYDRVVSLETGLPALLGEADHVVVTVPLTGGTRGLVGREMLSMMRPGSSLVVVSRGEVVDEVALCQALDRGLIGAAYLDRPTRIPPPLWSRLYRTRGLILTHYSAAHSPNRMGRARRQFLAGLLTLLEAGEPPNLLA